MFGYLLSFLRALGHRILMPVPCVGSEKLDAKRKHLEMSFVYIPVSYSISFLFILESTDSLLFFGIWTREALK